MSQNRLPTTQWGVALKPVGLMKAKPLTGWCSLIFGSLVGGGMFVIGMTAVLSAPRLSVTRSVTSARPGMVKVCVTCSPKPSIVASPKFHS